MNRTPLLLPLALLILTGCTTPTPSRQPALPTPPLTPAPAPAQSAPPPVIEAKPATLTGSEESSTMLDSLTAFVTAVDGVPVSAGRSGWKKPLVVKAGPRRVAVAFNRGVFAARSELQLNARSEVAYQVRFATDAQLFGKNSYCEFWIVDAASGQPVTERTRVTLTKIDAGK